MHLNTKALHHLTRYFDHAGLLPSGTRQQLKEMRQEKFIFAEQLLVADCIHLHIKVADVERIPHSSIEQEGGQPQNTKEGYIKYGFPHGLNFIFSSIPVSEEERLGIAPSTYPYLDHIGIDIRDEGKEARACFHKVPVLSDSKGWPFRKQGREGKRVSCCHVQVNEKYWVYPPGSVYWEFASGKLLAGSEMFGCDLRPADPGLGLASQDRYNRKDSPPEHCCSAPMQNNAMSITNHMVAVMRYQIKNSKGEVLEDTLNGPAVRYLHGAGNILPLLEERLAGLKPGQAKTVLLSREEAPGTGDDFYFEVIVDEVRRATAEELKRGKPIGNLKDNLRPGCCC